MMKVSVVIPTYRRQTSLRECVLCLIRQSLPPDEYEIIVCDDENSPKTVNLIEKLKCDYPMHHLRYVGVMAHHGPAAARNCGWKAAQGEIIAFTDDDCLPSAEWLACGLQGMHHHDAIWGRVFVPLPETPTDYQVNVAGLNNAVFVTANCFCRKAMLIQVNGFDERFLSAWREDSDLYFNLCEKGASMAFVPDAIVVHPVSQASWGRCLKLQHNNVYEALLYKKHPALYRRYAALPIIQVFYTMVLVLAISLVAFLMHWRPLGWLALMTWLMLTLSFAYIRIKNSSSRLQDIWEMVLTSICIPPLAVYWRWWGYVKFWRI